MFMKRSWTTFALSVTVFGLAWVVFAILLAPSQELLPIIIMFLFGAVITGIGIAVFVWDWRGRKKDTGGKVDKNANYVFTLTTPYGSEVVTNFEQIQHALNQLEQTRQGMVAVKIEPPIANICSIDCCYREGYFRTYVLQMRENGLGYWFMLSDGVQAVAYHFKQLYVKKKKIDFSYYNRKETGEGRG